MKQERTADSSGVTGRTRTAHATRHEWNATRGTRCVALFTAIFLAGCASYGESKIELAEQARRGVKLAREATERREQQLAAFDARQRTQLDEAFDADVLNHAGLTADWVVSHRRAYSIALDALRGRRIEAERAKQKALENLDAVDRALVQLQQMQQAELKLSLPEVKP